MDNKLHNVAACQSTCSEAPIYREELNTVYWVDTQEKVCYSMSLDTMEYVRYEMQGCYQSVGIRDGGWIAQDNTGIYYLDFEMNIEKEIAQIFDEDSEFSFNDGTVGPDGCYYMGYFDKEVLTNKTGGMYRVNKDLSVEKIFEGYALPNGMAFSSDGTKFYFTEMQDSKIWVFDFDKTTGKFDNARVLVDVPEEGKDIHPDGLILDGEGCVWSAQWQGFKMVRYCPDGSIDTEVPMPVPTPTSMGFIPGGRLFVTTARLGCSEEQLEKYPYSGDCFIIDVGIEGAKEFEFGK